MAKETVRALTQHEFGLLKPELEAYIEGKKAQDRLTRMLGLFAPGCDLDLQTLSLTREVAEPVPNEEGCETCGGGEDCCGDAPTEEVPAASE